MPKISNEKKETKIAEVKKETNKKSANKTESATKNKQTNKIVEKKPKEKSQKSVTSKSNSKSEVTINSNLRKKNSSTSKTLKTTKSAKTVPTNLAMEYYDLPYRYNQTIVKILAQTPNILFVYWDISDDDRKNLQSQYGENIFESTKPYLLVTNTDKNYMFELEINDYSNSWYFNINDSNCKYTVELIRRPITPTLDIENEVIYIANSNNLSTPNDHILFEKLGKTVFFKDVQKNTMVEKNITNIFFIENAIKIHNISDLYKEIYKEELYFEQFGTKLNSPLSSSNVGGIYND